MDGCGDSSDDIHYFVVTNVSFAASWDVFEGISMGLWVGIGVGVVSIMICFDCSGVV